MILKPTLNPDEIFNQFVDLNREQAEIIRKEDDFNRLCNERSTTNLN